MKRLLNSAKAIRTLQKTPLILGHILTNITQEQALLYRDGKDGWNIVYIMCHLRDIESVFTQRITHILAYPGTAFPVKTNEELMRESNYDVQNIHEVYADYCLRRQQFIALLETIQDEQWLLQGIHPVQGPATLLDVAINTGLHDIDHIEQILRCA